MLLSTTTPSSTFPCRRRHCSATRPTRRRRLRSAAAPPPPTSRHRPPQLPPTMAPTTSAPSIDALRAACDAAGQAHLLEAWDTLSTDAERDALARDVAGLDFAFLKKALAGSLAAENDGAVAGKGAGPPPQGAVLRLSDATTEQRAAWRSSGLKMFAEGRAAVLLLAGGQGTRLGSALPKGCFDVGLPSRRPLYALQAERLLRLQHLAAAESNGNSAKPVRWFVMTSPATHADTVAAFEAANYWGLQPQQVTFFQQGTLPCLTPEGKVILEKPGAVARAPDGNGGLYAALLRSGGAESGGGKGDNDNNSSVLSLMLKEGIEALDCYCVDNAAARVGDPEFLGYCHDQKAGMGARVVAKASADERVGVFAAEGPGGAGGAAGQSSAGGRLRVLEYSELDPSLASAPGPDAAKPGGDPYLFNWANVCMHYFNVGWLKSAAERLAADPVYHVARKMIPSFASSGGDGGNGSGNGGGSVVATKVSGIKLEQFIFDPLPWASEGPGVALFEVERASHFAPVKNAEGSDSPATARRAVLEQGAAWVRAAGGEVEEGCGVEVSPLVSYAGEGLEERVRGKKFADGDVIA